MKVFRVLLRYFGMGLLFAVLDFSQAAFGLFSDENGLREDSDYWALFAILCGCMISSAAIICQVALISVFRRLEIDLEQGRLDDAKVAHTSAIHWLIVLVFCYAVIISACIYSRLYLLDAPLSAAGLLFFCLTSVWVSIKGLRVARRIAQVNGPERTV